MLRKRKKAKAVVSLCKMEHPQQWCNVLPSDGSLSRFINEDMDNKNRQDLVPYYYRLNGAIYLAEWDYIAENKSWFKDGSYAYVMPAERSIDIDTESDLHTAEFLLKKSQVL